MWHDQAAPERAALLALCTWAAGVGFEKMRLKAFMGSEEDLDEFNDDANFFF